MPKVLVGMSGGVDSSVAAKLLLDQGYEVAGVTLKLFSNDDLPDGGGGKTCCSLDDVRDAKAVCYKLGIDHFVFNFRELFNEKVIDNFVETYLAGKTPNPCIECNRHIKFTKLIERAILLGYDYVATGHYARIGRDEATERRLLIKGLDRSKDQSYVLYPLTQEQLARTLLPLGGLDKRTVREIAEASGLVNARKPDSQDICFVPDGDYAAFIENAAPGAVRPGKFVDTQGNVIGEHRGVAHYTIGQRRGIAAAFGKPMYVVAKDARTNTVTLGENDDLLSKTILVEGVNLISAEKLDGPTRVSVKVRYSQTEQAATATDEGDGKVRIDFDEGQRAVASGQAAVFYVGDVVLGGGTIA